MHGDQEDCGKLLFRVVRASLGGATSQRASHGCVHVPDMPMRAPAVAPPPGRRSLNESFLLIEFVNLVDLMPSASCRSPHSFGAPVQKAFSEQHFHEAAHGGSITPASSPAAGPGGPTQMDQCGGACGCCAAAGGHARAR